MFNLLAAIGLVVVQHHRWSPVQLDFVGPLADEGDDAPQNPFLDYRLTVFVTAPDGQTYEIPGFFDGDGQGGTLGTVWRARWLPHLDGTWTYDARFRSGPEIALDLDQGNGVPTGHDVLGSIVVIPPDSAVATGFYKRGRLRYVGEHYLRFDDRSYFLKGGTNSAENLLGYAGFDNTLDQPGGTVTTGLSNGLHTYPSHVADWRQGDPYFVSQTNGYDSRGIIGALNYLTSVGVNSVYFLPMNMGGDGRDTVPFRTYGTSHFAKTHYDVSKLQQWNVTFDHAQRMGILLHIVLGENEPENSQWLDGGLLGTERKLFYRELVARFGYLPALQWNLSEESPFTPTLLMEFADWIQKLDPYDHPITFHTFVLPKSGAYADYDAVLGDPRFSAASLQSNGDEMGDHVQYWRARSRDAGRKWVVGGDEVAPPGLGLDPSNVDLLRKRVLYDVYLSGGQIEWFCGAAPLPVGGDLTLEDFRTREQMWKFTHYARRLLQGLPFWEMEPMDWLLTGENGFEGGGEVFVKPGFAYAVYLPDATPSGSLDLTSGNVLLRKRWYDPRGGAFVGSPTLLQGGAVMPLGPPPSLPDEDWVCVFERVP